MRNHHFDEGLSIELTDNLELIVDSTINLKRENEIPISGTIPMPNTASIGTSNNLDLLLEIIQDNDLELVKAIHLNSVKQPDVTRSKENVEVAVAKLEVDLKDYEESILLLEHDGMYIWKYPKLKTMVGTRRGDLHTESTSKQASFQIQIALSSNEKNTRSVTGEIVLWGWGRIKAYVLKFIAGKSVELIKDRFEKNVKVGFVHLTDQLPEKWPLITEITSLNLPTVRPAKILLLIHGTFSSTVGSYGIFAGTPWGQQLLNSTFEKYDAVIGYNHFTLKEDPLENAKQLLKDLQKFNWPAIPEFDVIAYSRGGLVIRSLVELLLPESDWKPKVNKIIFVACTNEGTLLAKPINWENLINVYTNLAVATSRIISLLMPQTLLVTQILNDIIQCIGTFIKYCASAAITDKLVPGLSAMEPGTDFIEKINLIQPGQPNISDSQYFAITSDFRPLLSDNQEPKELPKRFLQLITSNFMEDLMKEANDLVVNLDSMTAIDKQAGNFILERYDFGKNNQVYHTNYFTRPEVVNVISKWLNLTEPRIALSQETVENKHQHSKKRNWSPDLPPLKQFDLKDRTPPIVDTNIISVHSDESAHFLLKSIQKKIPSYVVIRRPYQGGIINYAYTAEELHAQFSKCGVLGAQSIQRALNLPETKSWASQELSSEFDESSAGNTEVGVIVLKDKNPIGVIPPQPLPNLDDLVKIKEALTDHMSLQDCNHIQMIERQTCYFYAEMDEEVAVKRATSLLVTVSAEDLQVHIDVAKATSAMEVDVNEKIDIRIIVKSGFIITDENDGQAEIDVPKKNKPTELLFDIKATEQVGSGEIWVIARQNQVNIVKMVLKPQVVLNKDRVTKVMETKTIVMPELSNYGLNQLRISEHNTQAGMVYRFEFDSAKLKIRKTADSLPIKGDREKFVMDIYKNIEERWVSTHKDHQNFIEELRAFGTLLFMELIPISLQQLLWDKRDVLDSIQVISEEPFIPWELVHLKDPTQPGMPEETVFLGDLGIVRWLDDCENGWPPEIIKIRDGRVKYVIPQYPIDEYVLPEVSQEKEYLIETFNASGITPEAGAVRNEISVPGKFDLLHFACHGRAESKSIADARLLMEGRVENQHYIIDSFSSTIAKTFSKLRSDDNAPMVVLNACQVGLAGYQLTSLGGFAEAFLKGGAGAFIGTLWSVGDKPARYFIQTLYESLNNGDTLATATVKGRQKARQENDATWLSYVVYGNPYLRIRRES